MAMLSLFHYPDKRCPQSYSIYSLFVVIYLFFPVKSFVVAQVTDCLAENVRTGNFTLSTSLTYTEGVPVGENCVGLCVNRTGPYPDGMFWYPGAMHEGCRAYVKCQNWAAEVWLCPVGEIFDAIVGSCAEPSDDRSVRRQQCERPESDSLAFTSVLAEESSTPELAITSEDPSNLSATTISSTTTNHEHNITDFSHILEQVNDPLSHVYPVTEPITTTTVTSTTTERATESVPRLGTDAAAANRTLVNNDTQSISFTTDDDDAAETDTASSEPAEIVTSTEDNSAISTDSLPETSTLESLITSTVQNSYVDSDAVTLDAKSGATDAYTRKQQQKRRDQISFLQFPGYSAAHSSADSGSR